MPKPYIGPDGEVRELDQDFFIRAKRGISLQSDQPDLSLDIIMARPEGGNAMNRPMLPRMSIDAFEAWAEKQDGRYELVRGRPVMMNQTTRFHARITMNIVLALGNAVNRSIYDVTAGDFALQTGEDTLRLADIMITPAEGSGKDRRTDEAFLLVEILSPSTATDDFGDKQREYLALSSLQAYLIVAQDKVCAWLWIRGEDGFPEKPDVIEELDATLTIDALGLSLPMKEIYARVEL